MKVEQTECSETSAYKIQTLGNYPEESIQQSDKNLSAGTAGGGKGGAKEVEVLFFPVLPDK